MEKDKYYVYLLRCNDNTLYCGITNDLLKRVNAHNSGRGAKYTRSRLPVTVEYFEISNNKSNALRREHEIKKLSRSEKLELIEISRGNS